MKHHQKAARNDRILRIVLLVSAIVLLAALIYTLFFNFSIASTFLLIVLLLCVGGCLPAYWHAPKNSAPKRR
jgi:flagellar basal body-associated protein FliL